jgi:hypothetical protein
MRAFTMLCLISGLFLCSCARPVVVAKTESATVVKTLPRNYKLVKINGQRYYYFNGRHYKKTRNGYVLIRI